MKEIAILRGDLQRMRKAFCEATADERPPLMDIRDNLRERIRPCEELNVTAGTGSDE